MAEPRAPTRQQVRRRRLVAMALLALTLTAIAVVATHSSSSSSGGDSRSSPPPIRRLMIRSRAVGRELGVNVILPPHPGPRGKRSLLIFLHGRGGDQNSFNKQVLAGQSELPGGKGPVVAFPAGGDHGYWHNRATGDWDTYVTKEVVPTIVRKFGVDPGRLAIGGISMGGFGAFDIALHHPGRFCAVGGHSPALWFDGAETAPGAFEDAADFEANDVVGAVKEDPDAFGDAHLWIDYGTEDDFRVYDEGFVEALGAGDGDLSAHSWPGGHEGSYWNRHWADYQRFYLNALANC